MSSDNKIIQVSALKKNFNLPHDQGRSLKQAILSFRKPTYETQQVLKGISFEVEKGEFFGILGRNGSGKSTLLKLLANIYEPTSGQVKVKGDLTPFIELGIGFNTELSGKDNVFLNGAILGLTKKEIEEKYDDIVHFAELERFMDQKLRNYSSGMLVRLAFSIAIQAHNEILLIDEVLAVGDINFQQKCLNVFRDLKKSGKTVVLVTHDMGAVEEFCDRAILIDDGEIILTGTSREVSNAYRQLNFEQFGEGDDAKTKVTRWGNGAAEITLAELKNEKSSKRIIVDDKIKVTTNIKFNQDVDEPVIGIQIRDAAGNIIIGSNSHLLGQTKKAYKKGHELKLEWMFPNILKSGKYDLTVAAHDYGGEPFDWWDGAYKFTVQKESETSALTDVDITLKSN